METAGLIVAAQFHRSELSGKHYEKVDQTSMKIRQTKKLNQMTIWCVFVKILTLIEYEECSDIIERLIYWKIHPFYEIWDCEK